MAVITLSRLLGAGEDTIAPHVASELGWQCVDQALLDREVADTGIQLPYVAHCDERLPDRDEQRQRPQQAERYFRALQDIIREYAAAGNAVIVGRGANFILHGCDALHILLVADLPFRVRQVMRARWVNERPARDIIQRSDRERSDFIRHHFAADWAAREHYHFVLDTSCLGMHTVTAQIVAAARDRWPVEEIVPSAR